MHAEAEVAGSPPRDGLGNQIARWLLGITCFLWGTSQIAPPGALLDLSLGKIGVGDLTFVALVALMATSSPSFRDYCLHFADRCRVFTVLMCLFVVFGLLSAFTNSVTRDVTLPDLIEVLRPGYYLFVALVASYFTRRGFVRTIAFCFPLGVIAAAINNMYLVLTGGIDQEQVVLQLYNRNVVGNLLAIALVYLAIAFHRGIQFRSTLLVLCAMVLVAFSFSKGAWVMGLLGLTCFAVPYLMAARKRSLGFSTRILVRATVVAVIVAAVLNIGLIARVIEFKIEQSFTSDVDKSQSTVALRVGHVYSSLEIVSRNPIFGVGVTNWEAENNSNQYWLNDIFLVNDNPHNGYFYVLSGMGIPALLIFFALSMFPVALLPRALPTHGALRFVFASSLLLIILVSGNFMLHLLSHYCLWLLIGICLGLSSPQKDATAAAEMARL